ncbi:hypothetical protein Tsubulata_031552 [Turnera subulata]|uniref:Zinc knuckle CX2CX4HX4C domain-containing protein n=1 Tax=Turnera subulata TaxID=218843 RepID=A0A9Q0J9J7_9ROSI|nr:hypothetical protein Tsubulata_031552 [Turnera subulata]
MTSFGEQPFVPADVTLDLWRPLIWIQFRYEDIDLICYTCGLVSHKDIGRIWPRREKQEMLLDEPDSLGPWNHAHSIGGEFFFTKVRPMVWDMDWDEEFEEVIEVDASFPPPGV